MLLTSSQTTFQDLFKNSFLKLFPEQMAPLTLVLTLAVAFLIGLGIFLVYRKCFLGVVYDHSFNVSLGMVGALSIVRYRTAVKNPLDLMFLFWAITSGIAVGAQFYYVAIIAFFFVLAVLLVLRRVKGDSNLYILVINYDASLPVEEEILRRLSDCKTRLRSKIIKNQITELTLEIHLKMDNLNITQLLSDLDGVHDVTLVQYRGTYEI